MTDWEKEYPKYFVYESPPEMKVLREYLKKVSVCSEESTKEVKKE